MKKLLIKFLAGALIAASLSLHAADSPSSKSLDIGVSPFLDVANARRVLTNVNRLLLTLPPGMEFTIANAYDGSMVATGISPRLPFDSPSARAQALARQLVDWRTWVTKPATSPLAGSSAVNPPLYLRSVVERSGPTRGEHTVLLIGDPRYRSLESPSFDFQPNRLPSLGFLQLGEDASPFGCADRRTLLNGLAIHWWYVTPQAMPSEAYALASRSWWNSWLHAQSAQLGQYSHDWATVYGGLFTPISTLAAPTDLARLVASNTNLEMTVIVPPHIVSPTNVSKPVPPPVRVEPPLAQIEATPVQHAVTPVPVEEKPTVKEEPSVDPAPPVKTVIPPLPSVTVAVPEQPSITNVASVLSPIVPAAPAVPLPPPISQPVVVIPADVNPTISSVGIIWNDRKVDLDLSLRVKPRAAITNPGELYWNTPPRNATGSKTNALGRYLHDYRSGGVDYEWIELASDITSSDLAKNYEVWCDNYKGKGPVNITAAVVDHGRIIATRILTLPGNGDRRWQAGKREQSPSWLRVPVDEMIASMPKLVDQ